MFKLPLIKQTVRTRFAPSPTGYLHVGGLRTALYAYLFARQNKGTFVLRIEDTDRTREVPGAVENLLKSLNLVGLKPDEGVILGIDGKPSEIGHFGPYTQSQRWKIYQKYAQKLLNDGHAYCCFCSESRLEALRKEQETAGKPTHYDWHCRKFTKEDVQKRLNLGEKFVIRLKVPENEELTFTDWVKGELKVNTNEIDDQVLIKSDGMPTYHLASVIDDYEMKITHVIRGDEWLPSTPKHILLYLAFDWTAPQFIHLPLILNSDKSKLSKRQGDVSIEDYLAKGYLPEALLNFVALLGWNPGTEQEFFSLPELINKFDINKIHKSGAVFDLPKLDWMNREYIKKMPLPVFVEAVKPFLIKNKINWPGDINVQNALYLEQQRITTLSEAGQGIGYLLTNQLSYDPSLLVWKKSDKVAIKNNLNLLIDHLKTLEIIDFNKETLEKSTLDFIAKNKLSNGEVLWPMRVALTGLEKSPTPFEVAEVLGQKKCLNRLQTAESLL